MEFSIQIFQQTVGIPMGTNCVPLLADLFLCGYEAKFIHGLFKAGKNYLAQIFNFTYRYIDDVLLLKNSKILEFITFIYLCELEIKDTTDNNISASYLDCYFRIDNGKLVTRVYDESDDFNFPIVNFNF